MHVYAGVWVKVGGRWGRVEKIDGDSLELSGWLGDRTVYSHRSRVTDIRESKLRPGDDDTDSPVTRAV
jgi:hypothetical protein